MSKPRRNESLLVIRYMLNSFEQYNRDYPWTENLPKESGHQNPTERRCPSGKERNFAGEHLWAREYAVSTVGFELEQVRQYIRAQDKQRYPPHNRKEPPLAGEPSSTPWFESNAFYPSVSSIITSHIYVGWHSCKWKSIQPARVISFGTPAL